MLTQRFETYVLTHSSSSNGPADGHNSLLLPNDPSVQSLLHLDQLLALITAHLLNGDTCSRRAIGSSAWCPFTDRIVYTNVCEAKWPDTAKSVPCISAETHAVMYSKKKWHLYC